MICIVKIRNGYTKLVRTLLVRHDLQSKQRFNDARCRAYLLFVNYHNYYMYNGNVMNLPAQKESLQRSLYEFMISTQFHVDYLLLIYHLLHRSTKRIYTRYRLQPCIVSKIFISSRSSMLNLSRSKFYLKEIIYERVTCTFDVIKFSIQTSNSSG